MPILALSPSSAVAARLRLGVLLECLVLPAKHKEAM
jgi:hypothetical protein